MIVRAAGLLLAALIPMLTGWSGSVVVSGSMSPAVRTGDIVITAPPTGEGIRPGRVVRFRSPVRPGRSTLHRIAAVTPDGLLVTKGDANARADVTPVPVGAVTGVGRWRLPRAGLPLIWWRSLDHPRLAVAAMVLATLLIFVRNQISSIRSATELTMRDGR
ncbi:signal peptidase I [Actinoplanes sp. NPDC023714]|uniref:signal peptidase I n=1 Tax=Actinoplanes sp. NPDC023714 TaxID=3154322 RepID=UPI0033C644EB